MDDKLLEMLQEMQGIQRTTQVKEGTWRKIDEQLMENEKRSRWQYRVVFTAMIAKVH